MKKYFTTAILVLIVAVFTTCKKEPDAPVGGNKIEIGQTNVDSVGYYSAIVSSEITNTGGNEISQHGFCWSTEKEPTTEDNKNTLGKLENPDVFSSELTGLTDNTDYFIRSYFTLKNGVMYGNEQKIQTLKAGKPLVSTNEVSNITLNSAQFSGSVLADSGSFVISRGFCWDITNTFTITDCLDSTIVGKDLGSFTSEVTGLNEGVKYFVKAYAINQKGISYGEIKQFSTVPINVPEVNTTDITEITTSSAQSGGNVTSDGNGTVIARGIVWSTNENPSIENNDGKTSDGSGTGVFSSSLTNLQDGITYYVRSYATNEQGTAYGSQKNFQTTGIGVPTVSTTAPTNITITSALGGGNVSNDGNDTVSARGVCWSTSSNPTLDDSQTTDGSGTGTFISSITGLSENTSYYVRAYATNSEGTAYGSEITFTTLLDLVLPIVTTDEATNITGTTAISGGNVTSDGGDDVTSRGVCWSTSSNPTLNDSYTIDGAGTGTFESSITGLTENTTYYVRSYAINSIGTAYGNEITCTTISDLALPTVTTDEAYNIGGSTATSGGNVTSDGGTDVIYRGVCWSTSSNPTVNDSFTINGSGTGTFVSNITGLTGNTTYYVRAYAVNSEGVGYGNEITFTTLESDWFYYHDGTLELAYGSTNNDWEFDIAMWFTPSQLANYWNGSVIRMKIFVDSRGADDGYVIAKVWEGTGAVTLLYEENVTNQITWNNSINEVILSDAVPFNNAKDLWIGFTVGGKAGTYIPGLTEELPEPRRKGDLIRINSGWEHISDIVGEERVWVIEGLIENQSSPNSVIPAVIQRNEEIIHKRNLVKPGRINPAKTSVSID